ncbi:hypothetical protein FOA43_004245 [Brettanomyces nanus]|uniref:Uncharacterized protein n=1 Tax=Eeniella nana TaxID=13502 RepID=A0A875S5E4_EENNA|nr:uncharacterized protein FOA43_004245 [Brettanomyces nanus]QPG76851.1 hypothetical protein FOA43_004245 [Brettanomyces nanus]
MPVHSANKPKKMISRSRKGLHLNRKRAAGSRRMLEMEAANTNKLVPDTSFTLASGGMVTNRVVSKKRAKKDRRNMKYIKARNVDKSKLLVDLQAKQDNMDVDLEDDKKDTIRSALWCLAEDTTTKMFKIDASGEGTTLGGPSY